MRDSTLIAGAIVVGCALLSVGVYFGLRREPPPVLAPRATGASPPAPQVPSPRAPEALSPPAGGQLLPAPPLLASASVAAPEGPAPSGRGTLLPSPPLDQPAQPAVPLETPASLAARAALLARKPRLVEQCWKPALAREPLPATAKYLYAMSFDAQGKQIAQGISEPRDASRWDVARCLREQPMDLVIPPQGGNVSVEVTLELP
jgi:hypothetical protein